MPLTIGEFTTGWQEQPALPSDQHLEALVAGFQPDAVIPCSHIDDNHVKDRDTVQAGEKVVHVEGGENRIERFLNVGQIAYQQALDRVQAAIEDQSKFTQVLIDPGFDETHGNHQQMLQIVECLEKQGYKFVTEKQTLGKHEAVVHDLVETKVRIVYIAAEVKGEKLPNIESIDGRKL